jgi:hypothetical protein
MTDGTVETSGDRLHFAAEAEIRRQAHHVDAATLAAMLSLEAGLYPDGCRIRELASEASRRVLWAAIMLDDKAETYLVWSNEHNAWWNPQSRGYTQSLDRAGRYTREEALQICANARDGWSYRGRPSEIPVRETDAYACQQLDVKVAAR